MPEGNHSDVSAVHDIEVLQWGNCILFDYPFFVFCIAVDLCVMLYAFYVISTH